MILNAIAFGGTGDVALPCIDLKAVRIMRLLHHSRTGPSEAAGHD